MFFKVINSVKCENAIYLYQKHYPFYKVEKHRANRYGVSDKTTFIEREEGDKHCCMNPDAETERCGFQKLQMKQVLEQSKECQKTYLKDRYGRFSIVAGCEEITFSPIREKKKAVR